MEFNFTVEFTFSFNHLLSIQIINLILFKETDTIQHFSNLIFIENSYTEKSTCVAARLIFIFSINLENVFVSSYNALSSLNNLPEASYAGRTSSLTYKNG